MKKYNFLLVFICTVLFSCSKEKKFENRLEGNSFSVTITIDGDLIYKDEKMSFNECKNAKELCRGSWVYIGNQADFYWRFSNKAKQFELSNITPTEYGANVNDQAVKSYKFSGIYDVVSYKKDNRELILKSSQTMGYSGKIVLLYLMQI